MNRIRKDSANDKKKRSRIDFTKPGRALFSDAAAYEMFSLFAFGLQSPPKGATIPYRPKAMSAGAHAVLAPQHSAQVSIHTVVIPALSSTLYKRHNSAKASLFGNRREIELIKGSSPLEGHIFVIMQR